MIEIYTDGSCMNNPGVGGWAAVIMNDDSTIHLSGGEWSTTNNRMELTAAIKGLETLPAGIQVTVHSDSEYLVKTMTRRWKRNANQDLWEQLDQLANDRQIAWEWVKGHSGNFGNEEADRLAGAAMRSINSNVSPGFDQITETGLTHLDSHGSAHMVDISSKDDTSRIAVARAIIKMKPTTLALVLHGQMPKGDVFTVARIAGISGAKRTSELIPLAHQVPLSHVSVEFKSDTGHGIVTIMASARTIAKTGVEMEALTAACISSLAIYDMCKAADPGIVIQDIRLIEKQGGKRGTYVTVP